MLYGAVILGGGWIQGKFCKKMLRNSKNAAKRAAGSELGRDSRRGKILCTVIKYRVRVKQSAEEELVEHCYERQVGQLRVERWTRRLREELDTVGLGYMLRNARDK